MKLLRNSLGIGDRFAHQAKAQLNAIIKARELGLEITPVWNKSYREHQIIQSNPAETRKEADRAVSELGFATSYFIDADHINLETVDFFLDHSDYFTLDVAEYIGQDPPEEMLERFVHDHLKDTGYIQIPGLNPAQEVTRGFLVEFARKYLVAIESAIKIYNYLAEQKGAGQFITEVSMDEVKESQSPLELYFILEQLKDIPLQTIAPKFPGAFYKGVDYVGDLDRFEKDLDQIMTIISHAKNRFGYPHELKISIHSGSDKFSLYPIIKHLCMKHDQGVHLKTAGTTWLEEIIGLSLSGTEGLALVQDIYDAVYNQMEALCAPYQNVVQIEKSRLPSPGDARKWTGPRFSNALRHVKDQPGYNPHFRQLMHVGYKIAAQMGHRYLNALVKYQDIIGRQVTENLLERHIKNLFF